MSFQINVLVASEIIFSVSLRLGVSRHINVKNKNDKYVLINLGC